MRRWLPGFTLLLFATALFLYYRPQWIRYALVTIAGVIVVVVWPFIRDIIAHVISGKIAKKTPDSLSELKDSPLNILRSGDNRDIKKHLDEQIEMIRRMPFVFKDVAEFDDLVDNFINPDAPRIDLRTYKRRLASNVSLYDVIREHNKMVLLGSAGVGKTTFQRYGVLTVIRDRANIKFLRPNEDVVPFYVQLRYVNNGSPFPILNYLLENSSYLSGPKGKERLINLTHERKLFLFLDGYDEVPFSLAQNDNYLREELKILLSPVPTRITEFLPQSSESEFYREFYKNVQQRCRVWLSCRKEFFREQTPFEAHEVPTVGLAALEIRGVDNRQRLIEKVFSKYKPIQDNKELFKAELLVNLIERDVGELRALSDNPLLLIIICKIYTHEVIRTGDPNVRIANTLDTIIQQYLDLLLKGLDEEKDRQYQRLTVADKAYLKQSRGLWIEEKQEFLRYFAAHLYIDNVYLDNQGAFTLDYIDAKVREFFSHVSDSQNRQEILQLLANSPGLTDFTNQIKNSGVFIVAEFEGSRQANGQLFDFPHQRFRELLGAQYFDTSAHQYVLDNLRQAARSGLLYVFFRMTRHKDAVVAGLLARMTVGESESDDYIIILMNCLESTPLYKPRSAFVDFFTGSLEGNIRVEIPSELVPGLESGIYFEPDHTFIERITRIFDEVAESTINAAALSGELLFIYQRELLGHLLSVQFSRFEGNVDSEVFNLRADLLFRTDQASAEEWCAKTFHHYFDDLNEASLKICSDYLKRQQPELLAKLSAELLAPAFAISASKNHKGNTILRCELSGELLFIYQRDLLQRLLSNNSKTFDDNIDSEEVFNLKAKMFLIVDRVSAEDWLVKSFKLYFERLNETSLRICYDCVERHQPNLLAKLFDGVLRSAFVSPASRSHEDDIVRRCSVLRRWNEKQFDSGFAMVLFRYIRRNEMVELPSQVLDLFSPTVSFRNNLLDSIAISLSEERVFSTALAAEIGFHYFDETFVEPLATILLPAFRKKGKSIEKVLLTSTQIWNRLRKEITRQISEKPKDQDLQRLGDKLAELKARKK